MHIIDKINNIIQKNNSLVCVGLDSELSKIPAHLQNEQYPQFSFNKAIIEATHDLVCAYKPNTAFYEAQGEKGILELKMTCDYIKEHYPEIVIILDAKRADIGNTNNGYVKFAFDYLQADAITLHPYLGHEALKPFLDKEEKGVIILCRTSNSGSGEFQNLEVGDKKIFEIVAEKVINEWNENDNCLLVLGATYPEELKSIRTLDDNMFFLVPGIGAQGGDLEKTLEAGLNNQKSGLIINSSRGIIFADSSEDFANFAKIETEKLNNMINIYR
jgi:orotidine-5'-phosphate decarboxylase